jgi:hypothetical protein
MVNIQGFIFSVKAKISFSPQIIPISPDYLSRLPLFSVHTCIIGGKEMQNGCHNCCSAGFFPDTFKGK